MKTKIVGTIGAALLCLCAWPKADAQQAQVQAMVVSACGNQAFPAGTSAQPKYSPFTMLPSGNLCTNGASGGGGAITGPLGPSTAAANSVATTFGSGTTLPAFAANPTFKIDQTTPGSTNATAAQGLHLSTPPSLTNGQYYPLQFDIRGNLETSETGSSDPNVGVTPTNSTGAVTSLVGKASQGNLYRAYATATTAPAAQQYLACINATTAPSGGAGITPLDWAPFNAATAAGATAQINFGPGPPSTYSTGIVCLVTTSLTTFTAGTASFINTGVR